MKRGILFSFWLGLGILFSLWDAEIFASSNICAPAWFGQQFLPTTNLAGWRVEYDAGAGGSLALVTNEMGTNLQLTVNIGSGNWVQARYDFAPPLDLSQADLFGMTLRGDAAAPANTLAVMFADTNDVFFGYTMVGTNNGINQVSRWLINLPMRKKFFYYFWGGSGGVQAMDWSRIKKFFLVVKRPGAGQGGGSGQLMLNGVQSARAASWARQTAFESVNTNRIAVQTAASNAITFLLGQQRSTGLFVSWAEEPSSKAWLYDQALVLIALSREGLWQNGFPGNLAGNAAQSLAQFLVQAQKTDGHWARGWNPVSGNELADDGWVGDQAWCVMALSEYAYRSGNAGALAAARRGAEWLANKISPSGAIQGFGSTEGTVDVWWAMVSTWRYSDAEKIKSYLLATNNVWDADLKYWWMGSNNAALAMDCATWLSVFARHPLVDEAGRGMAALSFVRRTLATTSDDNSLCGFDGLGPVSIWNEGTAQYVAAGGEDASAFLETLLAQQHPNGAMPGSPDSWAIDAFGSWLSQWQGLAPTAWLYFAIRGLPFPEPSRDTDGDTVPDWSELVAGTDPQDLHSFFAVDQVSYAPLSQSFSLSWPSVSNRFYTVLSTTNLSSNWVPVSGYGNIAGTGSRLGFSTVAPMTERQYFRVEVCR